MQADLKKHYLGISLTFYPGTSKNSLIPSCPEASHEYQHGWACPATEPHPNYLVTHIHTVAYTHPYRHHLVQKTLLPALLRHRHTKHCLPTNSSITAPFLSHFLKIQSNLTLCVLLGTNFWRGVHSLVLWYLMMVGVLCVGSVSDLGGDPYLDTTGRAKHKTDGERGWGVERGSQISTEVFYLLLPNLLAYHVGVVAIAHQRHKKQQINWQATSCFEVVYTCVAASPSQTQSFLKQCCIYFTFCHFSVCSYRAFKNYSLSWMFYSFSLVISWMDRFSLRKK